VKHLSDLFVKFIEKPLDDTLHHYGLDFTNFEQYPMASELWRSVKERQVELVFFEIWIFRIFLIGQTFPLSKGHIDDFGAGEEKISKPQAIPLEKRINRRILVDHFGKECHMVKSEVTGMECLPRSACMREFVVSLEPPVVGGSTFRWFRERSGCGM